LVFLLADDHCPGTLVCEEFAEQDMLLATIDNMDAGDSGQSIQAGCDFRDHTTIDDTLFN
jgi:hypothetical protein